jgi:heparosan-N-sulfate-glucuronate 5-epimerase
MKPAQGASASSIDKIKRRLRLNQGEMSTFGSERSFDMPIGDLWRGEDVPRGYYIDFRKKCEEPAWPPFWLGGRREYHVATVQWALGAFERYLHGEGEVWLEATRAAAGTLLEAQHSGGPGDGGWTHDKPLPHSYYLSPGWISAITQGEGASLFTRLYLETSEERYAEAARRALGPMEVEVAAGGVLTHLEGDPFVEEYPTAIPSCVLNGAIFGIWGYHDVGRGLSDADASTRFTALADSLARNLWRYDNGYWSRYELYPHLIGNVATPAYHALHIKQLQVLAELAPRPEFGDMANRFEHYRTSSLRRRRALAQKIAFRIAVPRNQLFARRLPWNRFSWAGMREAERSGA